MKLKYIMPLKNCLNCFISIKQFALLGITIPARSIMCKEESTLYICNRFPNYEGDAKNVILNVAWYDFLTGTIGSTTIKNCNVSISLFNAWIKYNKPEALPIKHKLNMHDYQNMMKHSQKKKKGSSGVRLLKNSENCTTEKLKYKQVTEAAYWCNLYETHSGNASVVAQSIR